MQLTKEEAQLLLRLMRMRAEDVNEMCRDRGWARMVCELIHKLKGCAGQ